MDLIDGDYGTGIKWEIDVELENGYYVKEDEDDDS
jgi:hypothetical protein